MSLCTICQADVSRIKSEAASWQYAHAAKLICIVVCVLGRMHSSQEPDDVDMAPRQVDGDQRDPSDDPDVAHGGEASSSGMQATMDIDADGLEETALHHA